jgi:hypothetical protein
VTTKTFSDGATHRRYDLPTIDGLEGWGTIVLGADGFFAAVTDYGNYAYRWCHTGEPDFRRFVLKIGGDYLLGKISRDDEYDGEATAKGIRSLILERRRENLWGKEQAREEWDLVESCDVEHGGDFGFHAWYLETKIGDASEMRCDRYPNDASAFAEKTMPRLRELIRAEIAAEKAAA